jgi:hypothetical protein
LTVAIFSRAAENERSVLALLSNANLIANHCFAKVTEEAGMDSGVEN